LKNILSPNEEESIGKLEKYFKSERRKKKYPKSEKKEVGKIF